MATVRWSEQALDDLDAVCLFIARDSPLAAEMFARRSVEAAQSLERFPQSGRVVPELGQPDIRELVVGSYRLIYSLVGEQVFVLTLHHGARLLRDIP